MAKPMKQGLNVGQLLASPLLQSLILFFPGCLKVFGSVVLCLGRPGAHTESAGMRQGMRRTRSPNKHCQRFGLRFKFARGITLLADGVGPWFLSLSLPLTSLPLSPYTLCAYARDLACRPPVGGATDRAPRTFSTNSLNAHLKLW